jgi:cob(I)alamin adenosyltransferase
VVKIYTRKGDDGTTSLWYGGRVAKNDPRTEAYGAVDEANSALGAARSLCGSEHGDLAKDLLQLQEDLFVAGAELATAPDASERLEEGVSQISDEIVRWAEEAIDRYMAQVDLPPQFVIPGGTQLSASLDLARAVLRRAERRIVALRDSDGLASDAVLRFVNRASDLVYAMSRATDVDDPKLFEGRRKSKDA